MSVPISTIPRIEPILHNARAGVVKQLTAWLILLVEVGGVVASVFLHSGHLHLPVGRGVSQRDIVTNRNVGALASVPIRSGNTLGVGHLA